MWSPLRHASASRPARCTVSRDEELPAGIRALIVDPGIGAGQFISRMLDAWQVSTMMAKTVAAALAVLDQSPAAAILARWSDDLDVTRLGERAPLITYGAV